MIGWVNGKSKAMFIGQTFYRSTHRIKYLYHKNTWPLLLYQIAKYSMLHFLFFLQLNAQGKMLTKSYIKSYLLVHTIEQIFPLHVLFISTLFVESWSRFADENVDDEFWDI